ncbi:MAG: nicotinate (nicotinamide) nucleotide adenylyltransferase [Opitutae bacterium]|nr:nicotinate (nicotinamide) nucleotide adenylyltransferase [Opitutae bacterium]
MPADNSQKIGFYGGSFDPIHNGHLELGKELLEKVHLDRILFSPANQAPLRDRPYGASPEDRFTMVSAAVTDIPNLEATDIEIQAGGTNFTLDTLRTLKSNMPDANFSVIIGADQLAKLPRWRHVEDLAKETEFLVLARPGHQLSTPPELPDLRIRSFDTREFEVSSSEVRNRIRDHLPFQELVPPPVASIITQRKLYR